MQYFNIHNVPKGEESLVLRSLLNDFKKAPTFIYIASCSMECDLLERSFAFFAPTIDILKFPHWDCLPYDRISPASHISAERIHTLSELLIETPFKPRCILTTLTAVTQRVPPRAALKNTALILKKGAELNRADLVNYFATHGYHRVEVVKEPGEYALRGNLIDFFPSGFKDPLRIDFFDEMVETLRTFDPLTQRSEAFLEDFSLKPASEIVDLSSETIKQFRENYRETFLTTGDKDPLYQMISQGRPYPGQEHWLPLFYSHLETLFDYLPHALIVHKGDLEPLIELRLKQVEEHYRARLDFERVESYRPLPPHRLWFEKEALHKTLESFSQIEFSSSPASFTTSATLLSKERTLIQKNAEGKSGKDFVEARLNPKINLYEAVKSFITESFSNNKRVLLAGYSLASTERLKMILEDHSIGSLQHVATFEDFLKLPPQTIGLITLALEHGFEGSSCPFQKAQEFILLTEQDILGEKQTRSSIRRRKATFADLTLTSFTPGDYLVHKEHGVGQYHSLCTLEIGGAPHDCLELVYEEGNKLFVPIENSDILTRYGNEESSAKLDRLGSSAWQARKARVKKRLMDIADKLIALAAERQLKEAEPIEKPAGLYEEFAARFPYPETEDQEQAIEEVLSDLSSGTPMERLICGDVGFGKTEVALRAAFLVAASKKQVAVIVPTTLLCRQHFQTFLSRFKGLNLKIVQLSRLTSEKEKREAREEIKEGKADIVIATHSVLSKNSVFKNLGLLIIDEEQHFGVKQKEALKEENPGLHILTLTATPIPRTLQMSLAGVREMSLIATPPVDRLAVRTFVMPYDGLSLREAILREYYRGGQVFYVCPRLEHLEKVFETLKSLVPEVKVAKAHGQMPANELEEVTTAFYDHAYDVLLSTNIIESGIDIPTANTLIVHRADLFGLAQLYQLRGRIGRSKLRGYAYFTLPKDQTVTDKALKRLDVIKSLDTLGAGFTLASHDMDIRGAGNLIGEQQSGHIREVGVELYQTMLQEAIEGYKNQTNSDFPPSDPHLNPQLNIGLPVRIPENYIPDLGIRLSLYRRMASLKTSIELEELTLELIDRFGPLPNEVQNLLKILYLKQCSRQVGIEKIDVGPKGTILTFYQNTFSHPEALFYYLSQQKNLKLRPDHKLFMENKTLPSNRLDELKKLLEDLREIQK